MAGLYFEDFEIGASIDPDAAADVLDGAGAVLLPGFVDMHTHLREPGREDTETIETGSAAAALGGYTAVFAMANTQPVADSVVITDHVYKRGQEIGLVREDRSTATTASGASAGSRVTSSDSTASVLTS